MVFWLPYKKSDNMSVYFNWQKTELLIQKLEIRVLSQTPNLKLEKTATLGLFVEQE